MHSLFLCLVSILVSSQADFDRLDQDVKRELQRKPVELKVTFSPGIYRFKDDHLFLTIREDCPGTRLVFDGNGAVAVAKRADGTMSVPLKSNAGVLVVAE